MPEQQGLSYEEMLRALHGLLGTKVVVFIETEIDGTWSAAAYLWGTLVRGTAGQRRARPVHHRLGTEELMFTVGNSIFVVPRNTFRLGERVDKDGLRFLSGKTQTTIWPGSAFEDADNTAGAP